MEQLRSQASTRTRGSQINVKKGTPVLDCSAIHERAFRKPIYPRMYGEVVLPEGKGIVKSIDNDLRIIEVDFCM